MSEPLLGCPHCGKPVGYTTAMAGQVVACPHCRGQFQMPDRAPSASAAPPVQHRPSAPADVGLSFESEQSTRGPVKAELDSYRAASALATIFALAGAVGTLLLMGLAIYSFVLPIFRGGDDRPGRAGAGLIWLLASVLSAAIVIVGLFLARAFVLVVVDAARRLRALERDLAAPKTK